MTKEYSYGEQRRRWEVIRSALKAALGDVRTSDITVDGDHIGLAWFEKGIIPSDAYILINTDDGLIKGRRAGGAFEWAVPEADASALAECVRSSFAANCILPPHTSSNVAPEVEKMEFTCAKAMLPIGKAFNTFRLGQKWAKKLRFGDAVEINPHGLKATVLGASCLRGEQAAPQALENLTTLSLQAKYGLAEDAALAGFFKEIRELYGADPITEKDSEWSVVWLFIPKDS